MEETEKYCRIKENGVVLEGSSNENKILCNSWNVDVAPDDHNREHHITN